MAKISKEEVLKLAALSKLELTDEEVASYQADIQAALGLIDQLKNVDVSGYEPTEQVTGLQNVTRQDQEQTMCSKQDLLREAPDRKDDQFKVRRVMG